MNITRFNEWSESIKKFMREDDSWNNMVQFAKEHHEDYARSEKFGDYIDLLNDIYKVSTDFDGKSSDCTTFPYFLTTLRDGCNTNSQYYHSLEEYKSFLLEQYKRDNINFEFLYSYTKILMSSVSDELEDDCCRFLSSIEDYNEYMQKFHLEVCDFSFDDYLLQISNFNSSNNDLSNELSNSTSNESKVDNKSMTASVLISKTHNRWKKR